jgi:tyrosine-protein phosphatase 2/3
MSSRGIQVPFNPFFDTVRQNLELGGGGGSGDGIPLKLSRRVKRRLGDLPFEWLREIAKKSGSVGEDSPSSGSADQDMKMDQSISMAREPRGTVLQSESDVSESEEEAVGDIHRQQRTRAANKLQASVSHARDASPTSSDSTPSTDGEELAKVLAMQFYKIELGEQRRLMGVMEHHSMESGAVVDGKQAVPKTSQAMNVIGKAATVAGFSMNKQGIPSGGLCGPFPASTPVVSTGAPIVPTEPTNVADQPGQTYTGTAAARMLSGAVSEGGAAGPRDRGKSFPYSITAGVEKGAKNRYVAWASLCSALVSADANGCTLCRYRNIWPFEHARVRLKKSRPEDDDYMNASYVQPLGTRKRYIATQGPLPATFADFWS